MISQLFVIFFLLNPLHTVVVNADADDQGIEQFVGNKNCKPFFCKEEDYEPVQKLPFRFTSPGCTALVDGSAMNVGAKEDSYISHCCDQYHACLQICRSNKAFCRKVFGKCANEACHAQTNPEIQKKCSDNVETKKLLISFNTCYPFNKGQEQGCQCVPEKKLKEKRKNVLSAFYKKYKPGDIDKVDGLAAKATDSDMFAALMFKLISTYPKSIQQVAAKDTRDKMTREELERQKRRQAAADKREKLKNKNDDDDDDDDDDEL